MPELRKDPIVGRWVIIATERGKRPSDFDRIEMPRKGGFCPFCPGNESKTPPEVYADREPGSPRDGPGWHVRVVSNKFPALQIEGDLKRRGEGMYDKMNGVGAHEVIIESPAHETDTSELPLIQIERVLVALRERMLDLAKDKRFRYVQVFKNRGDAAGASLEHSHTQLIATPIIPRRVDEELRGCASHFLAKERCIYCDIVDQESDYQKRIVCENEHFLVFEPFASRFPFETWVLPKHHAQYFEEAPIATIPSLAAILKELLVRMNIALNNPPYNYVLHTSPCNDWDLPHHYHWHIELMPKLTKVAGFEWGTGFYINPTPPEEAATHLREVDLPVESNMIGGSSSAS
jgi:UDPglucose--hexose-1-phosphate uridylyltransferase